MNNYETVYIYSPDFPPEKVTSIQEKIKSIISQNGGVITLAEDWGRRKLAYRIGGNAEGVYSYLEHTSNGKAIAEIESMLKVTEGILRYMTVIKRYSKRDELAKAKAKAKAAAAAPAATGSAIPAAPSASAPVAAPAAPAENASPAGDTNGAKL